MCPSSEQYEQVCKNEFGSMHVKLDKLDEAIRGNGKPDIQTPSIGWRTRPNRFRLLWLVIGAAVTLGVAAAWKLVIGGF